MDVLSKPWNGLLLATLHSKGPLRFSELRQGLSAVGDRMLSARLKELATRGLVERHVIPGPPVRVEYELTAAGRGFKPVFQAIGRWGSTFKEPPATKARAKSAKATTSVTATKKTAKTRAKKS